MKTTYLKSSHKPHVNTGFVCITEKLIIDVFDTKIEVSYLDDDAEYSKEVSWYIENWEMEECTRAEFDEMFKKIATEINDCMTDIIEKSVKSSSHG